MKDHKISLDTYTRLRGNSTKQMESGQDTEVAVLKPYYNANNKLTPKDYIDACNLKTIYKLTPLQQLDLSEDIDIRINLHQSIVPSMDLKDIIINNQDSSSFNVTLINTINCILGSGISSLPWAFSQASIIPAIIGTILIGTFSCSTAIFVIHACEITQVFEFSALLNVINPIWEKIGFFMLLYCVLSSCVGYCIIVGDSLCDGMSLYLIFSKSTK